MIPHAKKKHISIPPELFKRHSRLDIRADLIDCYVDICSPDVPALFTENFDYQQIRRHFVHGILEDYELYGKTIHCHIATNHYAARVRSLRTYDSVSRDIISRWTYPLCPDTNNYEGQNYRYQRGNIYKEDNIVLGRTCLIKPKTVIGEETSIGEGSVVGNSVIGKNCKIGNNVQIEGAYIWDDVVIEDGCVVKDSIVASGAFLGNGSKVEGSAIVSFGVKLGSGTNVSGNRRLTIYKQTQHSDDENDASDEEEVESGDEVDEVEDEIADEKAVGAGGVGYFYVDSASEDEDEPKVLDSMGPRTYCFNCVSIPLCL